MKTWKMPLFWVGIAFASLAAFVLVLVIYFFYSTSRTLEGKIAKIHEEGEPLCIADLARKPIPTERNGAHYLLQIKEDLKAVVSRIDDCGEYEIKLKGYPDGKLPSVEMKRIHAELKAYPNIPLLLKRVATCPDFCFQYDYTVDVDLFLKKYWSFLDIKRNALKFLRVNADVLLSEGESEASLQAALLMLQLTRRFDLDSLTLDSYSSCSISRWSALDCAHKVLQAGSIDAKLREALNIELSLHDSRDSFQSALKSERVFIIESLKRERPYYLPSSHWQVIALNAFEDFSKYSSQPCFADISKSINQQQDSSLVELKSPARMLIPVLKSSLTFMYRTEALVRSLRIINALQRHNLLSYDQVASMAEMGLPKEVGIDPFNGKPFIVKKGHAGWLVYSVGQNLQDDGGQFENNLDVGFGQIQPPEEKGINDSNGIPGT